MFRITTNGVLTTLASFGNDSGGSPTTLVQGSDGNFYGMARNIGAYGFGTVFRVVMPLPQPPTLNVRLVAAQPILTWPTNASGFTLETTTNLNLSSSWIGVTNTPAIIGAEWVLTNTTSVNAQFFRLKK